MTRGAFYAPRFQYLCRHYLFRSFISCHHMTFTCHAATTAAAQSGRRWPDIIVVERQLVASGTRVGVVISDEYSMSSLSGLPDSATALSSANLFLGGASESAGERSGKKSGAEVIAAYRQWVLCTTQESETAFSALANREAQIITLT